MSALARLLPVLFAALVAAAAPTSRAAAQETILTVAGGCFWCVEADFESVAGVREVVSGYTGGTVANPTYKQVSGGGTGHYEAVQIHFNPSRITREDLLKLFFRSIDPTDAGGQFCDRGGSYRTAIFVSSPEEQRIAQTARANAEKALGRKIVTPILQAAPFYKAEDYHQDYYRGSKLILTRYGPKRQSEAYKLYRTSCGRDARVKALWGDAAPFVH